MLRGVLFYPQAVEEPGIFSAQDCFVQKFLRILTGTTVIRNGRILPKTITGDQV
jgi:hypothetical protein